MTSDHGVVPLAEEQIARLQARLTRERRARKEAEQIAESTLREVYQQKQELELLGTAARAANECATAREALGVMVDALCAFTGWPVAHVLLANDGELRSAGIWNHDLDPRVDRFRAATEASVPVGTGLPGRVLAGRRAHWIERIDRDRSYPRRDVALASGLHCGFAFPILSGEDLLGVVELYTQTPTPIDHRILELFAQVGMQVGRALERERAHEDLERARDELQTVIAEYERSNDELEAFAYIASHDLQEPLRTITGFVQLLSRRYAGRLDERADEYIAYTVDGAARMQQLITDLLRYSRVGRAELPLGPVALGPVVDAALASLGSTIEETGATVEVGELPVVSGDATQLEQVLVNLVGNALKFRSGAAPVVRIGSEPIDGGWRITVADNGIGIAPEDTARAFQLFKRINPQVDVPGTGIGLAICEKIIERHAGRIRVDPNPDGGSVFTFTLPGAVER